MLTSPSPRFSLVGVLLAVAALVGFAPAATAAPLPAAASTVEWTVGPADADGPDDRISLRHVIDPGAVVTDAIAVTNSGNTDATIRVTAGDGVVGTDGAFDIAPGEPEGAGSWITVDGVHAGELALTAGETRVLPVTIAVPDDATPGDHPAGIVVGVSQQDDGVTVSHRVGVRAHLQVSGDIVAGLEVSDVSSSFSGSLNPFEPGTLRVEYTVTNTGNIRVGAAELLTAAGPFGMAAVETRAVEPAELLPGDSVVRVHEVALPALALLTGQTTVTPVALGDDAAVSAEAVVAGFSAVAVPWVGLVVLLVLVLGVIAAVVLARRGRRRTQERIDAAVEAARAEDAAAKVPTSV